jgi:hypothetical protein
MQYELDKDTTSTRRLKEREKAALHAKEVVEGLREFRAHVTLRGVDAYRGGRQCLDELGRYDPPSA